MKKDSYIFWYDCGIWKGPWRKCMFSDSRTDLLLTQNSKSHFCPIPTIISILIPKFYSDSFTITLSYLSKRSIERFLPSDCCVCLQQCHPRPLLEMFFRPGEGRFANLPYLQFHTWLALLCSAQQICFPSCQWKLFILLAAFRFGQAAKINQIFCYTQVKPVNKRLLKFSIHSIAPKPYYTKLYLILQVEEIQ